MFTQSRPFLRLVAAILAVSLTLACAVLSAAPRVLPASGDAGEILLAASGPRAESRALALSKVLAPWDLRVTLLDPARRLPPPDERREARGLVLWLDAGTGAPPGIQAYAAAARARGLPVVSLGALPGETRREGLSRLTEASARMLGLLGLRLRGEALPWTYDLRPAVADAAMLAGARGLDIPYAPLPLVQPIRPETVTAILALQRRDAIAGRTLAIAITPSGGYAAEGYAAWEDNAGGLIWQIEPRGFFAAALRLPPVLRREEAEGDPLLPAKLTIPILEALPETTDAARALAGLYDRIGEAAMLGMTLQRLVRAGHATQDQHVRAAEILAAAGARNEALVILFNAARRFPSATDSAFWALYGSLALDEGRFPLAAEEARKGPAETYQRREAGLQIALDARAPQDGGQIIARDGEAIGAPPERAPAPAAPAPETPNPPRPTQEPSKPVPPKAEPPPEAPLPSQPKDEPEPASPRAEPKSPKTPPAKPAAKPEDPRIAAARAALDGGRPDQALSLAEAALAQAYVREAAMIAMEARLRLQRYAGFAPLGETILDEETAVPVLHMAYAVAVRAKLASLAADLKAKARRLGG